MSSPHPVSACGRTRLAKPICPCARYVSARFQAFWACAAPHRFLPGLPAWPHSTPGPPPIAPTPYSHARGHMRTATGEWDRSPAQPVQRPGPADTAPIQRLFTLAQHCLRGARRVAKSHWPIRPKRSSHVAFCVNSSANASPRVEGSIASATHLAPSRAIPASQYQRGSSRYSSSSGRPEIPARVARIFTIFCCKT